MKLRNGADRNLGRIFQVSLLLGFAGAGLAGCQDNNTGLSAQPALIGGLQRQADCSLTYFDFSVDSSSNTVTVAPNSQIPHYEKILHDDAMLLRATPDQFPSGCVDPNQGITSRPFLFLGTGKNGRELVALPGASGVGTTGLKSDGTFTPPVTLATPIPSISLVSGDLNKDGNADVVSINSNASQSSVTVFLGKDDGTYQPEVDYPLPGANAQYGVLDDLNGDGNLDLLVSSDSPAFAFSIFIGNGDGTFQPPQSFTPANTGLHYNQAFITADVNGDGVKDIVSAQGQVFLGTGDGVAFTPMSQAAFPPVTTATNGFAPSIVAADFNHDAKVDLATDDGLTIRTYLGNGDGTFTAGPEYPTIANYGFLAATDLDGDGNIDLWTGYGGNGLYSGDAYLPNLAFALMGNGDGTFQGVSGLPVTPALAATSTAVARPMAVAGQSITITNPSPSSISVVSGQTSAPFMVTVNSQINMSQTVTFSCSGLPAGAQCNFPSPPLSLAANASSMVSITIGPIPTALVTPTRRLPQPSDWTKLPGLTALVLLAMSFVLFSMRHRKTRWVLTACLLLVALTSLNGCGSGSGSSTFGGILPGTYAVGISALGSSGTPVNAANTLTLTVTAH
jgi:hypothetical protein